MNSKTRRKDQKQLREFTKSQDAPIYRQMSKQETTPRLETSIHSITNKSNSNLTRVATFSGNNKTKTAYHQIKLELETETSKYSIKSPMKPSIKKKEMVLRKNIYEEIKNNKIGIDSIISTILIQCDHNNQWCMHDQLFEQSSDGETLKQIIDFKKSWYKSIYKIEKEFLQRKIIRSQQEEIEIIRNDPFGILIQMIQQNPQNLSNLFKSFTIENNQEQFYDEIRIKLGMIYNLKRREYFNINDKHNLLTQYEIVSNTRYRRFIQKNNENAFCGCNLTCQF